eukprot:gene26111-34141_t
MTSVARRRESTSAGLSGRALEIVGRTSSPPATPCGTGTCAATAAAEMVDEHGSKTSIAHMPAPPEIAVQIYNRGTLPTMLAKMKAGESINQVIAWGTKELE